MLELDIDWGRDFGEELADVLVVLGLEEDEDQFFQLQDAQGFVQGLRFLEVDGEVEHELLQELVADELFGDGRLVQLVEGRDFVLVDFLEEFGVEVNGDGAGCR